MGTDYRFFRAARGGPSCRRAGAPQHLRMHREVFPAARFAICGGSHLHLLYEFARQRLCFCYLRDNERLVATAYELGTHATIHLV